MPKPYDGQTPNSGLAPPLAPRRESVLYSNGQDQSLILGHEIVFASGLDSAGQVRPTTSALRDGIQTVNGTAAILSSSTTVDGEQIRVISEVFAKRTDVLGDSAWFILRAVYINVGGTLTSVSAPTVMASGATAGASTWTAVLTPSTADVQTVVTGQAGKTIHWALIREQIEVG